MSILIQGMRRSGTTILYDALLEDPDLHCFYEPLREDTETPGGGSGARATDPFAETRSLRVAYRDAHHPDLDINEFNWGGPRDPALEIGPELPEHCSGFIRSLIERPEPVMIKFTRIYDKLEAIAAIDPEGLLVHVVRDPRSVTASMMMGRGQKRAERYPDANAFFSETERRKLWSSRQLSKRLLDEPQYRHLSGPANYLRILMVWKHTFESTYRDGRRLFGDRYILLTNEELRSDPGAAIARVYALAGRELPAQVAEWAVGKVKPVEPPYLADDPRWGEAFALLDMEQSLRDAGYPELADAMPEAPPAKRPGPITRARRIVRAARSKRS
jgi:hypothetical protein